LRCSHFKKGKRREPFSAAPHENLAGGGHVPLEGKRLPSLPPPAQLLQPFATPPLQAPAAIPTLMPAAAPAARRRLRQRAKTARWREAVRVRVQNSPPKGVQDERVPCGGRRRHGRGIPMGGRCHLRGARTVRGVERGEEGGGGGSGDSGMVGHRVRADQRRHDKGCKQYALFWTFPLK
jgi:hypothetical protein